ncbi:MAG TPA: chloramphenicol acetyltransferase [Pyrinomonadaceae bacterium]
MARYLDIENWSRRELFNFFIGYADPYFNVCVQLDVTEFLAFVHARSTKVSLALHYFAMRVANEIEPFRYRLKDGKVVIFDSVHGGTTVLLPNESFAYAYFEYQPDFEKFVAEMGQAVEVVRTGSGPLKPTMRDDVIYHTTLPWIPFTSFKHARTPGRGDSIPRIVFGKFSKDGARTIMPISVEVHHALMDGLHVGRYLNRLEEVLAKPQSFIS